MRSDKFIPSYSKGSEMKRQQAFRVASWAALVTWVGITLAALVVAALGTIGLTGWGDYRYRLDAPLPGVSLSIGYQPSWSVLQSAGVCEQFDVRSPGHDCYSLLLHREDSTTDQVRGVRADLTGRLLLDAEPGWNPLIASLYAMQVFSMLVVAFLVAQLWLVLRAAAQARDFTADMVRHLRLMGWMLVGWEFLEPFLWLFLSPKAHDYSAATTGSWPHLHLGSMEPGGPSLVVIAFGLLLLLLAEVFRHGALLAQEQELTV